MPGKASNGDPPLPANGPPDRIRRPGDQGRPDPPDRESGRNRLRRVVRQSDRDLAAHAGLVHRDLYACHIFLDDRDGRCELSLIDLAPGGPDRHNISAALLIDLGKDQGAFAKHLEEALSERYQEGAP